MIIDKVFHRVWKTLPHYLGKCRTRSSDRSYIVSSKLVQKWMVLKTVSCMATWISIASNKRHKNCWKWPSFAMTHAS